MSVRRDQNPQVGHTMHTYEICGKIVKNEKKLNAHVLIHDENKLCKCGRCKKLFVHAPNLQKHMLSHPGQELFVCGQCNREFGQIVILRKHVLTHIQRTIYTCSVCSKIFKHPCRLERHMAVHTGEKLHVCEVCDKYFTHKQSLNRHILNHTGERPFCCGICNKQCSSSGEIKGHMFVHTQEKPFACTECCKHFKRASALRYHLFSHNRKRTYICEICGKTFDNAGSMNLHMLIHNREKPGCPVCGKRFLYYFYLKQHVLIHYKPCTVCAKYVRSDYLDTHLLTHTRDNNISKPSWEKIQVAEDKQEIVRAVHEVAPSCPIRRETPSNSILITLPTHSLADEKVITTPITSERCIEKEDLMIRCLDHEKAVPYSMSKEGFERKCHFETFRRITSKVDTIPIFKEGLSERNRHQIYGSVRNDEVPSNMIKKELREEKENGCLIPGNKCSGYISKDAPRGKGRSFDKKRSEASTQTDRKRKYPEIDIFQASRFEHENIPSVSICNNIFPTRDNPRVAAMDKEKTYINLIGKETYPNKVTGLQTESRVNENTVSSSLTNDMLKRTEYRRIRNLDREKSAFNSTYKELFPRKDNQKVYRLTLPQPRTKGSPGKDDLNVSQPRKMRLPRMGDIKSYRLVRPNAANSSTSKAGSP